MKKKTREKKIQAKAKPKPKSVENRLTKFGESAVPVQTDYFIDKLPKR